MPDTKNTVVQMLPYQTLIHIESNSKKAIYEQIAINFINLINKGSIPAGTKLPSSRTLADLLKLHRKTIVAAYEELIIQGWIVAKSKSGYYVNSGISASDISTDSISGSRYPSKSPISLKIQCPNLLKEIDGFNEIFIDDGLPDSRIAPYKALLREFKSLSERDYNLKGANYGSAFKSSRLKDALVSHLVNTRGINHSASNIFITNGAQMGIYLVGKALINTDDIYLVGSPGYDIAKLSFEANGARIIEIPVDDYGIDVEEIAVICKRENVRGVYVIPHHHYPTTVTLSPERRIRLLSLAHQYNFAIIEDDYDYDFHYSSAPYLPMASYNHGGRVIYIGSLSKCFSSSLRFGFVVGSEELINAFTYIRKIIDIRGDILMENSLAALFENGEIQRHLRKSLKTYKERRDYMCMQIDTYLKNYVSYHVPSGGMAVWMEFRKDYNVERIASSLKKQGIAFSSNILFSQHDLNNIRLGFASLSFKEIDICIEGIKTAFT